MITQPATAKLLRGVLSVLIAVLLLRTFVGIGWIQPIVVSGGSMVPHHRGPHRLAECADCGVTWPIDPAAESPDPCSRCEKVPSIGTETVPGDRLLAWRAFNLAKPRRWETVLLRSPEDARQWLVKRAIGLPNERLKLEEGDVWIDGVRLKKTLAEQRAVRVLLEAGWEQNESTDGELVLDKPLTDDLRYNAHVSRRLQPVRDRSIEFLLSIGTEARLEITPGWPTGASLRFTPQADKAVGIGAHLPGRDRIHTLASLPERSLVTVSTFDAQLLVAIDDETVLRADLDDQPRTAADPLRIKLLGDAAISEVTLYRDLHYETPTGVNEWNTGANAWFFIGDNQAISRDSRNWSAAPGVPARLIEGVVR